MPDQLESTLLHGVACHVKLILANAAVPVGNA